jgi:hypothetical protein
VNQPEEPPPITSRIQELAEEFWERVGVRYDAGAVKYGPGKFLTLDTMEEALNEMADLANYAMMSYVRVRLLQEALESRMNIPINADFTRDMG